MASLVPCPDCSCHVRLPATHCPHCGAPLASSRRRTAAALLLGLSAVTVPVTASSCGSDVTEGDGPAQQASSSSTQSAGGEMVSTSTEVVTAYGVGGYPGVGGFGGSGGEGGAGGDGQAGAGGAGGD